MSTQKIGVVENTDLIHQNTFYVCGKRNGKQLAVLNSAGKKEALLFSADFFFLPEKI